MDDLVKDIFPLRRTLDNAVDQAEETSFRHAKLKTFR